MATGAISPALEEWLATQPQLGSKVHALVNSLRRRKDDESDTSYWATTQTLLLLQELNKALQSSGLNIQEVIEKIKAVGAALQRARPTELAVGNAVRPSINSADATINEG